MTQQHHQNHATWECKYHVVFIPKYRKKTIFGVIKKRLGDVFHELARRRESKIEEGHLMPDHAGLGDDQSLHQEPRDAGSRTGSALNDPIVPSQK